jgi:hypothetical protein
MPQRAEDSHADSHLASRVLTHARAMPSASVLRITTLSGSLIISFLRDMSYNTGRTMAMQGRILRKSFLHKRGACCAGGVDSYLA